MHGAESGRRSGPGAGRLAVLFAVGAGLFGCDGAPEAAAPRLEGGAPTLEALGAAVWAGLTAGDTAALEGLRLSEHEHNDLVWPEQPAAQEPSAAQSLDFWWENIQLRNRAALTELLRAHGGSELALEAVECPGEPRSYASFRALTDCRLVLTGPGGRRRLQAFRHVIVMDGRHKVVRYDDQE